MEESRGGGGGTEKRARSCGSVSRIKAVMSWDARRALVKILGGGNLGVVVNAAGFGYCGVAGWYVRE